MQTHIWTAVSKYVLVAILAKRLEPKVTLCELLQILSVTLFEEHPTIQLISDGRPPSQRAIRVTN